MPLVFFLCSQFVLSQLAVKSNFVSKLPFSLFEVSCKIPFNAIYQILLKGRVFSMMCRLVLLWYQTKVLRSLCILYWANYENRRRKWNLGSLLFASGIIDNCVSLAAVLPITQYFLVTQPNYSENNNSHCVKCSHFSYLMCWFDGYMTFIFFKLVLC